jgi:5-hydroxyisourate hydrolase
LDAVRGGPARGVAVRLEDAEGRQISSGATDPDGRITALAEALPAGRYRIVFDSGAFFAAQGLPHFYPEVIVSFQTNEGDSHYHVPILLSPFAYSTYRGS